MESALPLVPEYLPYISVNEYPDSVNTSADRLQIRSYIPKPRKWQVDADILGDPIGGGDIPSKWTFHEEGEEDLQLPAAIEIEAGGNSAGCDGPLNFSAGIKAETGINWKKTVKTQYVHDTTIDEAKLYVPILTRAKLMSDVISVYNTSFALSLGVKGVTVNTLGVAASDGYSLDRHQALINNGIPKSEAAAVEHAFGHEYRKSGRLKYEWYGKWYTENALVKITPRYMDPRPLVYFRTWNNYLKFTGDEEGSVSEIDNYALVNAYRNPSTELISDYRLGVLGGIRDSKALC